LPIQPKKGKIMETEDAAKTKHATSNYEPRCL